MRGYFRNDSQIETDFETMRSQTIDFLEHAPIGIVLVQEGHIRVINPVFRKFIGYSMRELQEMDPFELVHPDDRDMVRENARKMLAGETRAPWEVRMFRKNGEMVWGILTITPVQYENESASLGTCMDVTEKKRAEGMIQQSETRYKTIFENTGTATIIMSEDMTIQLANTQFEVLSGYPKEEIEGKKSWTEFVFEKEKLKSMVDDFYRQRQFPEFGTKHKEIVFQDRFGNLRDIYLTTSMIPGSTESVASLEDITRRKRSALEVKQSLDRLQQTMEDTIRMMASTIEIRDPYTAGHMSRVARLAKEIAVRMGLLQQQILAVEMAAAIHDLGKIIVPSEILSKPGSINVHEFSLIKMHCQVGHDLLHNIDFPWPLAKIVLQHHEKLDGSGYPNGTQGRRILTEARILTVADIVEAMATHRPYRAALPIEEAITEITRNKGILYDYEVVDACLDILNDKNYVLW